MANLNITKSENEVNQINVSPRDSTSSDDSCALHPDESKSTDELVSTMNQTETMNPMLLSRYH